MTLVVRSYRASDLDEAAGMWHASKKAAFPYVELHRHATLAQDRGHFATVVAVECTIWLAELAGCIAGLMAMKGDLVDQLFVAVGRQRQGIGSALLAIAQQLSPRGVRLFTFRRNAPARAFYERRGFSLVRFGVSPAPENEPDVEYRWNPSWRP